MNTEKILESMTNIKPTEEQIVRIECLRDSFKNVVLALAQNCKDGRETALAVTNLENSLMWAVKGIVLEAK